MRWPSQAGTRPPWSGRSALPARFAMVSLERSGNRLARGRAEGQRRQRSRSISAIAAAGLRALAPLMT